MQPRPNIPSSSRTPVLAALIAVSASLVVSDRASVHAAENPAPLRVIVPMYVYPAGDGLKHWEAVNRAAKKVPVVAIINPDSGPGKTVDPNYVAVIKKAAEAKVEMIGYVSTDYGKIPAATVKADIDRWRKLYPPVRGWFFDEQASGADMVPHYAALAAHARKASKGLLVANPGTICDEAYFKQKTADVWCVFEDGNPPSAYQPPAWAKNHPAERFYLLSYKLTDAKTVKEAVKEAVDKRVGALFLTDGILPNPWDRVPPYFDALIDAVVERNRTAR